MSEQVCMQCGGGVFRSVTKARYLHGLLWVDDDHEPVMRTSPISGSSDE